MYKTSTFFIKDQIPGTTLSDLVYFYKREMQDQNLDKTSSNPDTIIFSNEPFNFYLDSRRSRFSSFSSGEIKIEAHDTEFVVCFKADISRLFIIPGITAGIATVLFLLSSGFYPGTLVFGAIIFILIALTRYITLAVAFPVYFTQLRNNIEYELQNRT